MTGQIPPALGEFPAGSRIASYQIEELVGRGGMAAVYRASDIRLGRQVALKVLAPDLARNDAFRQRFIRESRAGAAVDHPNVIPVFEAGESAGILFIAMPFVAGQDVRALIRRLGRLPADRVVSIVTQVASALDAAHAHGLVHRDVKPANMLLGTVGDDRVADHVYLSDFGLSKQSVAPSGLTATGQFLGTIDYMSPEQVEGKAIDGRADLYALACAAFEMLAGQPPFRRDQNLAVMWAQVSAPPPPVRTWRPDLAPDVDAVLSRALAKSPADRYASCREFAAALRAACAIYGPGPVSSPAGRDATVADWPEPAGLTAADIGQDETCTGPAAGWLGQSGAAYPPGHGYPPGYSYPRGYGSQPGGPVPGLPGLPGRSGYPAPGEPPRRPGGRLIGALVGLVVVIALAGAALLVLRPAGRRSGPLAAGTATSAGSASASPSARPGSARPTPSSGRSATPSSPPGPAAVVSDYVAAINAGDYPRAWQLDVHQHGLQTYASFQQGFAGTRHDSVTILAVSGDVVSVDLAAQQTDGSVQYFTGTYTVRDGRIVDASIRQT
jgi:tRNA A-37 threonylcarbamoyl transferase component Bud32